MGGRGGSLLRRRAVETHAVNTKVALIRVAIVWDVEADASGTTALAVCDFSAFGGARGSLFASRTVRHSIEEVHVSFLRDRDLHFADGEFLIGTAADLRSAGGILRNLSLNAFVLHKDSQNYASSWRNIDPTWNPLDDPLGRNLPNEPPENLSLQVNPEKLKPP